MLHLGVELDPRTFDYMCVCVCACVYRDTLQGSSQNKFKAGGWGWFEDRNIVVVLLRSYDRVK